MYGEDHDDNSCLGTFQSLQDYFFFFKPTKFSLNHFQVSEDLKFALQAILTPFSELFVSRKSHDFIISVATLISHISSGHHQLLHPTSTLDVNWMVCWSLISTQHISLLFQLVHFMDNRLLAGKLPRFDNIPLGHTNWRVSLNNEANYKFLYWHSMCDTKQWEK